MEGWDTQSVAANSSYHHRLAWERSSLQPKIVTVCAFASGFSVNGT